MRKLITIFVLKNILITDSSSTAIMQQCHKVERKQTVSRKAARARPLFLRIRADERRRTCRTVHGRRHGRMRCKLFRTRTHLKIPPSQSEKEKFISRKTVEKSCCCSRSLGCENGKIFEIDGMNVRGSGDDGESNWNPSSALLAQK